MASMMAMESRRGREEAVTVDTIGRASGMDLAFTGFIRVMFMLGNGLMGRVMGVECILVRMEVATLGNSSGASSMDLATTISGNMDMDFDGFSMCFKSSD